MTEHSTLHTKSPRPNLARRLLGNSMWNLLAFVAYIAVTIVSAPLYIHYLGIQQYGLLVLLMSVLVPLNLVNFGFGKATIKFVAECLGRGDTIEAGKYVQTTMLFNLGIGVVGAVLISVAARPISRNVFGIAVADQPMAEAALLWLALDWIVTQLELTLASIPVAAQNYRLASIGNTVSASLNVAIGLIVLAVGGSLLNLVQARLIWGVITVVAWGMVTHQLIPQISLWPKFHFLAFQRSFRFSVWQTLSGLGGMLGDQTDKYLLGIYLSTTAVGLYSIPQLIYKTAYGVIEALGQVLFPAISELQGSGQEEDLRRVVLNSSWLLTSLMVVFMGVVFVFAHDILRLYLGPNYTIDSAAVLQLFAFAAIISAPAIGITQYLLGTGKTNWLAAITLASGVIVLAGGLVLIPALGLRGAAWSNLIAIICTRPLMHFLIWKRFWRHDIRLPKYLSYLYGPSMAGIIVAPLALTCRNALSYPLSWVGLILGGFIVSGLLITAILALDLLLPWGAERRSNLSAVVRQLVLPLRRTVNSQVESGL